MCNICNSISCSSHVWRLIPAGSCVSTKFSACCHSLLHTHTPTHTCFNLAIVNCCSDIFSLILALQGTGGSSCIHWWPSWRSVWRRWWTRRKGPWPLCSCRRQSVAYRRVSTSSRGETWSSARRWVATPRRGVWISKCRSGSIVGVIEIVTTKVSNFKCLCNGPSGKGVKCLLDGWSSMTTEKVCVCVWVGVTARSLGLWFCHEALCRPAGSRFPEAASPGWLGGPVWEPAQHLQSVTPAVCFKWTSCPRFHSFWKSVEGEEIGMLEDMEVGIADLQRVVFQITEAKTDDLSDLEPLVCGRRWAAFLLFWFLLFVWDFLFEHIVLLDLSHFLAKQ